MAREGEKMRYPKVKSEEEMQKYRENRERLQGLIDIITKWQAEEGALKRKKNPPKRMFKWLSDDLLIKDIAIAPRVCGMKNLELFLATEILEIYPWERAGSQEGSKVTISVILNALSKGAGAKDNHDYNRFEYKKLEECFLPEENKKAAQRLSYIKMCGEESRFKNVKGEGLDGLRLMEEIRSKTRLAMSEYSKSCKDNEELKEEEKKNKKELYEKCLMAVALHEIYLRQFCEDRKKEGEKILKKQREEIKMAESIKPLVEEFDNTIRGYSDKNRIETESGIKCDFSEVVKNMTDLQTLVQEIESLVENYTLYGFFLLEHLIGFYAEIQIIMHLEGLNLQREGKGEGDIDLEFFKSRDLAYDMEFHNRKGKKLYRELYNNYIKDSFLRFAEINTTKKAYTAAVEEYFLLGDDKKQQERILSLEYAIGKSFLLNMDQDISFPKNR